MRNSEILVKLDKIEKLLETNSVTLMTFQGACDYLQISSSALYKLVFNNKIKSSKPNGKRLWFTKQDLDAWALSKPNKTLVEIENEAVKYLNK